MSQKLKVLIYVLFVYLKKIKQSNIEANIEGLGGKQPMRKTKSRRQKERQEREDNLNETR